MFRNLLKYKGCFFTKLLAATPLAATPQAATPLAATPLAATPLAATPLATKIYKYNLCVKQG